MDQKSSSHAHLGLLWRLNNTNFPTSFHNLFIWECVLVIVYGSDSYMYTYRLIYEHIKEYFYDNWRIHCALIFIVNKWKDRWICNFICDASTRKSRRFVTVKKQVDVSFSCVCRVIDNEFWILLEYCKRSLQIHWVVALWIHSYFDGVLTKCITNNRTGEQG